MRLEILKSLNEERAARRRQIWCGIGRAFSWVILALGLAAGYAYRDEIGRVSHQLTSRSEPPGAEQQAKVRQMFQQVEKHNAAVEDAGK